MQKATKYVLVGGVVATAIVLVWVLSDFSWGWNFRGDWFVRHRNVPEAIFDGFTGLSIAVIFHAWFSGSK